MLQKEVRIVAKYEAAQELLRNGKRKTRWFPVDSRPRTVIEEAMVRLKPLIEPHLRKLVAGYEWWVQSVDAGSNGQIGFHLDKDESVASNKMYLVHPEWSSIIYMTGIGGCTLIIDQHSPDGNGYRPPQPEEGELVCPRANRFVIFNGTLLHGVIPGREDHFSEARDAAALPTDGKRVTFLVNWWDHKPELPNCDYLPYDDVPDLTLLSKKELKGLRTRLDLIASDDVDDGDDGDEEDEEDEEDADEFLEPLPVRPRLLDLSSADAALNQFVFTLSVEQLP